MWYTIGNLHTDVFSFYLVMMIGLEIWNIGNWMYQEHINVGQEKMYSYPDFLYSTTWYLFHNHFLDLRVTVETEMPSPCRRNPANIYLTACTMMITWTETCIKWCGASPSVRTSLILTGIVCSQYCYIC